MNDETDFDKLMRFVLELRQGGVTDARVLAAMERTPRAHFAPEQFKAFAMEDRALPLPDGEFMTKPSTVARVLAALELRGGETVLEVGTGSGYQAAALATIARRVVSLERRIALAAEARARIGQLRLMHVYVHAADGADGWAEDAPYDAIVVNAAIGTPSPTEMKQLASGGVLVAPVVGENGQRLMQFRKGADGSFVARDLGPAQFAPMARGLVADATGKTAGE
ncbi:MAG: protein-L-isoaspartate(D-aspartate) O-methyltransferase [Hyphomonadaceae bacterium]|nr:protein-L-isoaspartate(D-aspartate) O-methyltransferase [Hyphomonadaceae bacterium]